MSPRLINQIVNFIFDNLILLIFFASVIIPMLRRAGKNQQPNTPRPNQPANRPASPDTSSSQQPSSRPAEAPAADFKKRLEEARRRVQEAMEDTGQTQSKPPQPTTSPQQSHIPAPVLSSEMSRPEMHDRGLLSEKSFKEHDLSGDDVRSDHPLFKADHSSTFLPSESVTSTPSVTSSSASFFAKEQAPLEIARRKQKSAKLTREPLLEFDEQSITKGLIWHYILSEPHARKRRKLFPHQS